jgi:hypothetical protein
MTDCYNCEYRQQLNHSHHSGCLLGTVALFKGINPNDVVKMNPHGVKNGWCYYPFDFDPIWIESCNCFKAKEEVH